MFYMWITRVISFKSFWVPIFREQTYFKPMDNSFHAEKHPNMSKLIHFPLPVTKWEKARCLTLWGNLANGQLTECMQQTTNAAFMLCLLPKDREAKKLPILELRHILQEEVIPQ